MREFDRGTRGWFLRKVVLGHGGGGYDDLRAGTTKYHPPPLCISYANVHNYYSPYAYCSLAIEQWKVQQ